MSERRFPDGGCIHEVGAICAYCLRNADLSQYGVKCRPASESVGWLNSEGPLDVSPVRDQERGPHDKERQMHDLRQANASASSLLTAEVSEVLEEADPAHAIRPSREVADLRTRLLALRKLMDDEIARWEMRSDDWDGGQCHATERWADAIDALLGDPARVEAQEPT